MAAIRGSFIAVALCLASPLAGAGESAAASWSLASPKGDARATFAPGAGGLATVVVEQRTQKGWSLAWRGALRPEFTATSALLADDGRLVIFADAASDRGDAIVLHDARGRVVRELDLGLFLPTAYVQALPRDEGGVHWRREAKLAGAQDSAEFSVAVPGSTAGASGPSLRFSIDLRDGSVRTAQIREYLVAADRARTLVAGTAATQSAPRFSGKVVAAGVSTSSASMPR
jgi:hypothetical protein